MSVEAHRAADTILGGQHRLSRGELKELAVAFISADRDRRGLLDLLEAKRAEVGALLNNADDERLTMRRRLTELKAEVAKHTETIASLQQAMSALEKTATRIHWLEQSHRTLSTLAMHAKRWRAEQFSSQARQALIDSVDALGDA